MEIVQEPPTVEIVRQTPTVEIVQEPPTVENDRLTPTVEILVSQSLATRTRLDNHKRID